MAAPNVRVRILGSSEYINHVTTERGGPPTYVSAVERIKPNRKSEPSGSAVLEEIVFILTSVTKLEKLVSWLLEVPDGNVAPLVLLPSSVKADARNECTRVIQKKYADKCHVTTEGSGSRKRLCISLTGCLMPQDATGADGTAGGSQVGNSPVASEQSNPTPRQPSSSQPSTNTAAAAAAASAAATAALSGTLRSNGTSNGDTQEKKSFTSPKAAASDSSPISASPPVSSAAPGASGVPTSNGKQAGGSSKASRSQTPDSTVSEPTPSKASQPSRVAETIQQPLIASKPSEPAHLAPAVIPETDGHAAPVDVRKADPGAPAALVAHGPSITSSSDLNASQTGSPPSAAAEAISDDATAKPASPAKTDSVLSAADDAKTGANCTATAAPQPEDAVPTGHAQAEDAVPTAHPQPEDADPTGQGLSASPAADPEPPMVVLEAAWTEASACTPTAAPQPMAPEEPGPAPVSAAAQPPPASPQLPITNPRALAPASVAEITPVTPREDADSGHVTAAAQNVNADEDVFLSWESLKPYWPVVAFGVGAVVAVGVLASRKRWL